MRHRPLLLGSIYLVRSLSFIVLMNVGTSYEMMFLFAVIYGIFDYSTVPPTASLVASHLGLKLMGLVSRSMGQYSIGTQAKADRSERPTAGRETTPLARHFF